VEFQQYKIFFPLKNIQRGFGALPASYSVVWTSISGVNRPGLEAEHSPLYRVEVKNEWPCTSAPFKSLHGVDRYLVQRRSLFPRVCCCCCCFQARSQNIEKQLLASSCPSVRPSIRNNSAPTTRILITFDIWDFIENLRENSSFIKFRQK
jgi:hypothetical protein